MLTRLLTKSDIVLKRRRHRLTQPPVLLQDIFKLLDRERVFTLQTTLKPIVPVWEWSNGAILVLGKLNIRVVAEWRTLLLAPKVRTTAGLRVTRVSICSLTREQLVLYSIYFLWVAKK